LPARRAIVDAVDALRKVWRFGRTAPLTYAWLIVLGYTTTIAHDVNRQQLHHLLVHRSTNLHHLGTDPVKVLIESLLWIDGRHWLPYVVIFTSFSRRPNTGWANRAGSRSG
jgi:Rhomboid-like protein